MRRVSQHHLSLESAECICGPVTVASVVLRNKVQMHEIIRGHNDDTSVKVWVDKMKGC